MKRRTFIAGFGSAAAWPMVARGAAGGDTCARVSRRRTYESTSPGRCLPTGPEGSGLCEGKNVTIEYRWANGQHAQLPMLAAELVKGRTY